jgi:hypothetical protein
MQPLGLLYTLSSRSSHCRRQMSQRPTRRERSKQREDKEQPRILPKCRLPRNIWGSFTCRKSTTWNRRLYFPSEGRRAGDFFALKNPTASTGFEPANLGTRGQHASSRPPKPLHIRHTRRRNLSLSDDGQDIWPKHVAFVYNKYKTSCN